MSRLLRWLGQAVAWAAFAAAVGYLGTSPAYRLHEPDEAAIKLSISHPGQRVVECRRRTAEELARLAPNMRRVDDCPRRRHPVTVELALDGRVVFAEIAEPAGFSGDGASSFYRVLVVPSGTHRIAVRMRDGAGPAFDYALERDLTLAPAQARVIGFRPESRALFVD